MSGPGDLPPGSHGRIDLVLALSVARDLPADALDLAASEPARIADAVVAVAERAANGGTLSDREGNLLFWGVHALAEARETRLFQPLLRLMKRPDEELDGLLADTITETFPRMAVSLYDGDWPALQAHLADRAFNPMARWSLFDAMATLAAMGRIDREEARAFLARFDDGRMVGSSDEGWMGWEDAIALLGFGDLAARVDAARRDGRLLEDLSSPEDFARTLRAAEAAPGDLARFADRRFGEFGSAVEELDHMLRLGAVEDDAPAPEPVRNPLREVGRNDPCPCGSGRKYKRCCLAAA